MSPEQKIKCWDVLKDRLIKLSTNSNEDKVTKRVAEDFLLCMMQVEQRVEKEG